AGFVTKVFPRFRRFCQRMSPYRETGCLGNGCHGRRVMGRSEAADLARLAAFGGRIFHAPIGYVALLQQEGHPVCRIGAGADYWDRLEALPAARNLVSPVVIQDFPDDFAEVRFAAMAPIETLCRKPLGMLVIGDHAERTA